MNISGIIKTSLIDFPGEISCVLFTPGCNFDCFYCHNKELLEKSVKSLEVFEVNKFLEQRKFFLDGVVISGGEPTLQPDLIDYMIYLKSLGFKVKLDSNGSSPDIIGKILDLTLCDYLAIDYKTPSSKLKNLAGKGACSKKVLETINLALKYDINIEVRTTVYPDLSFEDLVKMSKELPLLPKYVLNRYKDYTKNSISNLSTQKNAPYSKAQIETFAANLKQYQPNISY